MENVGTGHRPTRRPSLLVLLSTVLIGLAIACAITYLLPGFLIFGIAIACLTLAFAMYRIVTITGRRWAMWAVAAAIALAGVGGLILTENLGTMRDGEATEVQVIDHTVETEVEGPDRNHKTEHKVYTHKYTLERPDGSVIDEPLVFYGEAGYDGLEEGRTATVLIDRDDDAPMRPAEALHIGIGSGLTIAGLIAVVGVFGMCALLVAKEASRQRMNQL